MTSSYGDLPPAPPPPPPSSGGYGYGYGYGPPPRGERPPSVRNAVRLMYAVAAIGVISAIVTLATKSSLQSRIERANPTLSHSSTDSLVTTSLTIGVGVGIVFLVLYVLLAIQVSRGKNWARVVTWVFAGLGVLGALSTLASTETPASRVFSLIQGILDVAIIVLLAQAASNRYFKPPAY